MAKKNKEPVYAEHVCWQCKEVHTWERIKEARKVTDKDKAYTNKLYGWRAPCGDSFVGGFFFTPGEYLEPSPEGRRKGHRSKVAE